MTKVYDDHPGRCTWRLRMRDGSSVECSDAGAWTLDKAARTWRPVEPADRSRRCWAHGPGADAKPHTGGRRRAAMPNRRLQVTAGVILGLSLEVTKALDEVTEELSVLGFPGAGGRSSYLESPDPVAGDAVRIAMLTAWREDLRDAIEAVASNTDALARLVKRVRSVHWAQGVKLCAENQQGREGSREWGEPTCTELPVKADLCSACYQAERRWHQARERVSA